MDFSIPERVQTLKDRYHAFVRDEVLPREQLVAELGFKGALPQLEALRSIAKDAGLWAPQVPRDFGGLGMPLVEFAHVAEELGRSPLGHWACNCQAPDAGNIELLLHSGSPDQRSRWLRPLIDGEIRSCFSMTEPALAGSNPVELATTAVRDGDGWQLDGHKWFTTSADGAAFAIVMAVTDPENPTPWARASMFLVPLNSPGVRLVRNIPVGGHTGSDWASHGELAYEGVKLPADALIGQQGTGFVLAQERLGPGRIHHCMRWIGIAERALDMMCRRAADRELSPGKPLASRQVVQHWIADSRAEIHASRLMVLHAAWQIDREGLYAARENISLIKFTVAGMLQRVLDRAIQVHGALGITDDTPLALWWGHERGARIYDGPDEVHRDVVARRILRTYGAEPGKSHT